LRKAGKAGIEPSRLLISRDGEVIVVSSDRRANVKMDHGNTWNYFIGFLGVTFSFDGGLWLYLLFGKHLF
jgi:hypothetical protein